MKRLILIRPGETDWNRTERWQGWVQVPLNDQGRRQAQRLAKHIRHIGVGALYASDLCRAVETAEILGENLGFAPIYDKRLRERDMGQWQGLTIDEMRAWYPVQYERLLGNVDHYQVPGGESRADVRSRVLAAFDDIRGRGRGETVAIITHTTVIHVLLEKLLGDSDVYDIPLVNMSVTTVARNDDGTWKIVAANDVLHLEGMETYAFQELEDKT